MVQKTQISIYGNFKETQEISQNLLELLEKYSIKYEKKPSNAVGY
jgi:hypothetical protein